MQLAEKQDPPAQCVRDKLWIWGHYPGAHDVDWPVPKGSRMTPAEGAFYLNVPNLIMVRYDQQPTFAEFDKYGISFRPLERVVWSVTGGGGYVAENEVERVRDLALRFPNICGIELDDFFGDWGNGRVGVFSPDELRTMKEEVFTLPDRRLEIWVTFYDHQLTLPVADHLSQCAVLEFWTWESGNLSRLEENFARVEELATSCRKVLGCYMFDYGERHEMPLELMQMQCETGLRWLKEGRIDGMIFLASCICDLELQAVEWTRQWIAEVGEELL